MDSQHISERDLHSEFWSNEIGYVPRIVAALWFAAAALIPAWFFYAGKIYKSLSRDTFEFLWEFGALPILTASICGFVFGAKILDRFTVNTSASATWYGIKTSVVAYIVYLTSISLLSTVALALTNSEAAAPGELLYRVAGLFLLFGIFGSLVIGWLILIVGAMAGYLLFSLSRLGCFAEKLLDAPRIERVPLRIITAAMASFLLLASIPFVLHEGHNHKTRMETKKRLESREVDPVMANHNSAASRQRR